MFPLWGNKAPQCYGVHWVHNLDDTVLTQSCMYSNEVVRKYISTLSVPGCFHCGISEKDDDSILLWLQILYLSVNIMHHTHSFHLEVASHRLRVENSLSEAKLILKDTYIYWRWSSQRQINPLASVYGRQSVNEHISHLGRSQFTARRPAALSISRAPCPFLPAPQSPVSAHGAETTRCHASTRSAARWKPWVSSVSAERPACLSASTAQLVLNPVCSAF